MVIVIVENERSTRYKGNFKTFSTQLQKAAMSNTHKKSRNIRIFHLVLVFGAQKDTKYMLSLTN